MTINKKSADCEQKQDCEKFVICEKRLSCGDSVVDEEKEELKSRRVGAVAIVPRPPFSFADASPLDFSRLEVLVVRRSANVASPGALCFPGGGVEPGETPRDAVRREFLEEVGLDVEVGRFLAENRTPVGGPLFWFAAEVKGDKFSIVIQRSEVAAFEWRTLPDLLNDSDFLPNNFEIVRKIVKGEIAFCEF